MEKIELEKENLTLKKKLGSLEREVTAIGNSVKVNSPVKDKKTLEGKFEPAFEIVEDSFVTLRCRCSCFCPPPCNASYSRLTYSLSVEYTQKKGNSEYK